MNQLFEHDGEPLLDVTIPWTPKAKARPRVTRSGVAYTEPETRKAEEAFRKEFLEAVGDDFALISGPIEVHWTFSNGHVHMQVWSTPDYTQRKLRGDLDNYLKLISDALNGVAYEDDKQIVSIKAAKL